MQQNITSCLRRVGGTKICSYCEGLLIKHSLSAAGKERYKCKSCGRTQVGSYTYNAYYAGTNREIIMLTKEGMGIRSTARVLKISATTLLGRIAAIAKKIKLPFIVKGSSYEVDEIRTFVKRKDKLVWVVYALERSTRQVVSFNIGGRTNKTLSVVLQTLRLSNVSKIYTDGLVNYKHLVDQNIHRVGNFGTNHIERNNLTLRTHLKRLNRRSICFSRSISMLRACLMIYFFS